MKSQDPFYKSSRWKNMRERVLRRDQYTCQLSKRYGKLKQADTVHHVFPREFFPEWQLCGWNLISVCREEHNKLHDRETDKLTAYGMELLKRIAQKNNIQNVDDLIKRMD